MIACFGEMLLRFSPASDGAWLTHAQMPVYMGGAELNVARALALWGHSTRMITALPEHAIANEMVRQLQLEGIDTGSILRHAGRLGTYFLPQGTDLKQGGVIYDRASSAFASLQPGYISWEKALQGCTRLHVSAIIPALNDALAATCLEAMQAARSMDLQVSMDLNYRSGLWQYGQSPLEVMPPLVALADVVMGNIWSVESLLGLPAPITTGQGLNNHTLLEAAHISVRALKQQFNRAHTVAYTFRMEDRYFGVLQQGSQQLVASPVRALGPIVDKVGSGDCFMAGLLHGLERQMAPETTIGFAAAAAIRKLGERGDATKSTELQIAQSM